MILDIHTHHPAPSPEAVVSVSPVGFSPVGEQAYSVGFHPWDTATEPSEEDWRRLEECAALPCVKLIGECGVDTLRGGPMFRQLLIFKRQVDLSERLGLPLLIHDVKAHDIIIGVKKDLKPAMPWIIHGFRGKPGVARMLLGAGCMLSFGEKFNPESLAATPLDRILAETDESQLTIHEVIASLSRGAGSDLLPAIATNTMRLTTLRG